MSLVSITEQYPLVLVFECSTSIRVQLMHACTLQVYRVTVLSERISALLFLHGSCAWMRACLLSRTPRTCPRHSFGPVFDHFSPNQYARNRESHTCSKGLRTSNSRVHAQLVLHKLGVATVLHKLGGSILGNQQGMGGFRQGTPGLLFQRKQGVSVSWCQRCQRRAWGP